VIRWYAVAQAHAETEAFERRVDRASMRWRPILSTIGVTDLVGAGDASTPAPFKIVSTIRDREEVGAFDRHDPCRSLRLGEQVRATAGAFGDMVDR